MDRKWTHYRALHAGLSKTRPPDDPDLRAARVDLAAARLENHVKSVVDTFPAMTEEQRNRIAAILQPAVNT